jgi:drug/metabolite transporter (DMT)-like permease
MIAAFVLGERPGPLTWVGGAAMIGAGLLAAIPDERLQMGYRGAVTAADEKDE